VPGSRDDDVVAKPVDADALLAVVERWVRSKATESADQPKEAAVSPLVVLDQKKLATVEALVGREPLQALVGSFLSDLGRRLAAITAPGAACGTIEREAHALVSLAGNLGLVELSVCSRKLMHGRRSGEEADIPGLVQALNAAAERARACLQER